MIKTRIEHDGVCAGMYVYIKNMIQACMYTERYIYRVYRRVCIHNAISIDRPIHLSIHLFICLSIYLSVGLSIYLCMYLAKTLCTYLFYIMSLSTTCAPPHSVNDRETRFVEILFNDLRRVPKSQAASAHKCKHNGCVAVFLPNSPYIYVCVCVGVGV